MRASKEWTLLGSMMQAGSHIIDGRILYISAWFYQLPGVVEVWMHPSKYLSEYKKETINHIQWWLEHVAEETNARRIQTWGANTLESDRWLSYLGFQREGVLDSYLPDGGSTSIWRILCKQREHC